MTQEAAMNSKVAKVNQYNKMESKRVKKLNKQKTVVKKLQTSNLM